VADATLQGERQAQQGVEDLRAADDRSRLSLLTLAQNGLDPLKASRRATAGLQTNLANANAQAPAAILGNTFSNTADTYRRITERQQFRRGFGYDQNRKDLYGG